MILTAPRVWQGIHPLHAMLLAFPLALFTGALCSDIAYIQSAQIMWSNFSEWLIAGGLFGGGFAALWALIDALRFRTSALRKCYFLHFVLIAATWLFALFNSFVHAHDAWPSVMPNGIILSIIVEVLVLAAAWTGYARRIAPEVV